MRARGIIERKKERKKEEEEEEGEKRTTDGSLWMGRREMIAMALFDSSLFLFSLLLCSWGGGGGCR